MNFDIPTVWLIVGFAGQAFFSARFFVQWIMSERLRRSVIPVAFWYFSIGGGVTLLVYAIHREDPVFIAGQGLGLLVYARNLWFIWKERQGGTGDAAT
ncbi:MAG: lipid-A-disaccharide synthase N-terminal domain-containing protein [Alphaproteobacteria bacterium]|nr:lipid-A-disaccharide synthase N-terminal domain-containing protein [Alphaproteobacteria bacterium]